MNRFSILRSPRRFIATLLLIAAAGRAGAAGLADRVVVLANSEDPDSVAIARHYAAVRGVPDANLILLPMSQQETITRREFVDSLWTPLEERLIKDGWIDAIAMDLRDAAGRRKYAVSGNRIGALVVCRGVPLKIDEDKTLLASDGFKGPEQLHTNKAAVDSELSLLAQPEYTIVSYVRNPLFGIEDPSDAVQQQVVKVSRLDGPTAAEAMGLVDLAVKAEASGLVGRAYIDLGNRTDKGTTWLETTAAEMHALGFDLSLEHGAPSMPETARFDAPVLYFGWYSQDLNGPFQLPGFRFPQGAIAFHIHSFSAHTLRSPTEGWCGPFVALGATATLGNVYEPYLESTHRPDLFFRALASGRDLVDAAYFSLPALRWQSIVIGDPLYRPFANPNPAMTGRLKGIPPALTEYSAIRSMNLLDLDGKHLEAISLGQAALKKTPGLALSLAVAERMQAARQTDTADWTVNQAVESADPTPDQWAVFDEAARFLYDTGHGSDAVEVYRKLLSADSMPPNLRLTWLKEGRATALKVGDASVAAEWQGDIESLPDASAGR
jgi:uncharacterized protein (TIGR03790 family)